MPVRVFWSIFSVMLAFPAALHLIPSVQNSANSLLYLIPSYFYQAAPHIVVGLFAVKVRNRTPLLLFSLLALNVALVAFALWVHWDVPARERGLAWMLYIPLSAFSLLLLGLVALFKRYRLAE